MSDELLVPESRGVSVELLATVDLGREIDGMDGRRFTTTWTGREPCTSCRE